MPNPTPQQILEILQNMTCHEINQLGELLGPCQASINLMNAIHILKQSK
jgi:hypothetical protein